MPAWAKPRVHSELYDLTNDPEEAKQNYNYPEYAVIIIGLRKRFKKVGGIKFKQLHYVKYFFLNMVLKDKLSQ